jgi:hypothetical protein
VLHRVVEKTGVVAVALTAVKFNILDKADPQIDLKGDDLPQGALRRPREEICSSYSGCGSRVMECPVVTWLMGRYIE